MASLGETFRPHDVPEDERNFDVMPVGTYELQVIESDVVPTKAGDGEILNLTIEVVNGPCANRKIWERLNIRNPNAQAQSISLRAFADLCLAVGKSEVNDSEELHFIPFRAQVGIEKDKTGQYPDKNKIKRYLPAGNAPAPVQAKAAPAPAPAPAKAAGASRPWGNR